MSEDGWSTIVKMPKALEEGDTAFVTAHLPSIGHSA